MHDTLELFTSIYRNLTNAEWINAHYGLYLVMFIIFAETGLFAGFFLPGDSLLFVSGMMIAMMHAPFEAAILNLIYWIVLLSLAGIIGNMVGYWIGNKSGHLLMKRPDSFFFKKKRITQAHEFFEKKGGGAIIFARFLPVIRTFVPVVAGMADMTYKKYIVYSIAGALAWVSSMTTIGFILGKNEWVIKNLDKIVILIILVTTGPVLFKMFFGRAKATPTTEK